SMIAMAALAGLGGLFSPAIFPTLAVSLAWMIWTYRKLIDIRRAALLSGAVVMIFLLPWGVRNRIELGQFIFSRSNFGLELAIGNAPGALGYSGSGTGNPLHPHDSLPAAREVARVGEVAYMHKMTAQALDWIRADPARFAMLCLTRLRLLFFPLPAMAGWYPGLGSTLPFLLLTLLGILRLGALASVVWLRARPIAAILYTVLPLAPYVLAHVSVRYESTTFFVSVVMISLAIDRALSRPSRQES
ncbi:MAG: hypothetical protein KGJ41_14915, partial [Rhodospirillales bacterium]|nr:hypothetical protein [Rhodospirillales bacterium]